MIRQMLVILLALRILAPASGHAQTPQTGICDGDICGPARAFTVETFPTLTPIDWSAFPANPPRPDRVGRDLYVAPDGSDANPGTRDQPLASLAEAIRHAGMDDVVIVADGEYALGGEDAYEGLVIDTPGLTILAENVGGVALVPAHPYTQIGIQARADDLIIDGFVIRGFRGVGVEFGRVDSPQRNLILRHLRVEQTEEGIRSAYGGDGSQPVVDGMLIYDVWLRDIGLIGLQCGEGPCDNLRWEALRVDMSGGDSGNSGADAIAVESGENVVIFNAEVSGAAGDGIDLKSARNAVANVWVHDLGRNGIKLWDDGDVINALVCNTGADAAIVFEAGNYRVTHTLVARHNWGNSAYAMTVAYDSPDQLGSLTITNSVFYQNAGAVWVSPAMRLLVSHSLFFGSGNGMELEWGAVTLGELDQPISGAGNLGFVDPLFANPDACDYAFGPDSPLFDAGAAADAAPLPDFDLYGRPRVIGLAPDLGPVEIRPAP
jgi:hypothetical protein